MLNLKKIYWMVVIGVKSHLLKIFGTERAYSKDLALLLIQSQAWFQSYKIFSKEDILIISFS